MRREAGYSYMEVILCMLIIGIVISPILRMMHISAQVSNESQSIYKATYDLQNMMEEIREVITVYLEQEIDNFALNEKERKYEKEIKMLLEGTADEVASIVDFLVPEEVDEEESIEKYKEDFAKRYETHQYIYDIGIWRVKGQVEGKLINQMTYDKATKLSTKEDEEAKEYQDLLEQLVIEEEVQFNTSSPYNLFKNNYKQSDSYRGGFEIIWQKREGELEGILRDESGRVQEESVLLRDDEQVWGSVEKVRQGEKDYYYVNEDKEGGNGEVKITLELGKLGSLGPEEKGRPIVIENKTSYDLVVEIIYLSEEDENINRLLIEDLIHIENKNQTLFTINSKLERWIQERFIIVGLARKKEPELGEKGKIIKKMIDIYSPSYQEDKK